jgi:hypothetical protein
MLQRSAQAKGLGSTVVLSAVPQSTTETKGREYMDGHVPQRSQSRKPGAFKGATRRFPVNGSSFWRFRSLIPCEGATEPTHCFRKVPWTQPSQDDENFDQRKIPGDSRFGYYPDPSVEIFSSDVEDEESSSPQDEIVEERECCVVLQHAGQSAYIVFYESVGGRNGSIVSTIRIPSSICADRLSKLGSKRKRLWFAVTSQWIRYNVS